MLRIRLQRKGRKKRPIWHIVVAEKAYARDGRIVEKVGRYDNVTEKKEVILQEDRILYWLDNGAQPTDTVNKILRREGILYKRHLMNWGKSEEEVEAALAEWKEYRDSKKDDSNSRKEEYKEILAAEEKVYKEQLQKKAKEAAAEVEAEKAAKEAEAKAEAEEESADDTEAPAEEAAEESKAEATEEAAAEEQAEEPVAEEAKETETEAVEETAEEEEKEEEPEAAVEEEAADEPKEETKEEAKEEEKAEASSGQVSTDMTAKDAIDHINDTDLADLKGFVPEDEDRVTVQRAWESKQEG